MMGDSSLFKRADMIKGGWAIAQPVLDAWASGCGGILHKYSAGSSGPAAAVEILERDGHHWRDI
jgi:glucose-6-phosphate 1-dehydrogenase